MRNYFKRLNIRVGKETIMIFIIVSLVFLAGCSSKPPKLAAERARYVIPDSLNRVLKIDTVVECPLATALTLTGKVAFNDEKVAKIFPLVSGNITNVKVQLGDYVSRGQQLAVIRSGEMASYGNDLISARTNLLVAKKNMDAAEDMYKSGLMSQKDFINAQAMHQQAQSQLKRSNQILQINGGNTQGQFYVKAPISGFIVEKQITNNMSIRPDNTSNLFTISDLKNVWVLANVYESNINKVHLGDKAEITTLSYPGKTFIGNISKILNVLDPASKVMKIRVVLDNPGYLLKPEMFANVNVISKSSDTSLCIPSTALIFDHSQYYVLLYNSKDNVKIVPVNVINKGDERTYISGPLKKGDLIIGSDNVLIYDAINN